MSYQPLIPAGQGLDSTNLALGGIRGACSRFEQFHRFPPRRMIHLRLTRHIPPVLVQVGELVGIGVLDHVIVAERGVVSLRARQML